MLGTKLLTDTQPATDGKSRASLLQQRLALRMACVSRASLLSASALKCREYGTQPGSDKFSGHDM
jgi:hypothetical protein